MFNRKSNVSGNMPVIPLDKAHSILSQSTMISGEIGSKGDLRIDGNIEGNINCEGKVVIGPDGSVHGNIKSSSIELMGKITGNIIAYDIVILKSSSYFNGEITATNLEIEKGAKFIGTCKMLTEQNDTFDCE
jgi:cytoskeletal protein CcmA (bactofilin family)